jgi:hypothetical protein
MKLKFLNTILAVLICSLSGLINVANAGLIFSEDFGSGNNRGALTTLDNWDVTRGNVDLWNFPTFPGYSLDMDGSNANATIETKSTFNFTPGNIYELSFSFGNNTHAGNVLNFTFTDPSIFNETLPISIAGTPPAINIVRQFTVSSPTSAKLVFSEQGSASYGGSIIDDIQLSYSQVPEPSTLAIFALGLIGLASRRFKQQLS